MYIYKKHSIYRYTYIEFGIMQLQASTAVLEHTPVDKGGLLYA